MAMACRWRDDDDDDDDDTDVHDVQAGAGGTMMAMHLQMTDDGARRWLCVGQWRKGARLLGLVCVLLCCSLHAPDE
jgi:hypothetical protein